RDLLDDPRKGAVVLDSRGRMPGEAANVHFVDDQFVHRPGEKLVSLPVVVVNVDDNAAHGGRQIVGRPDSVVAANERLGVAQGIRVDQHLVAVEAKPSAVEILWSINTVGVKSAGLEALDIHVPQEETSGWRGPRA